MYPRVGFMGICGSAKIIGRGEPDTNNVGWRGRQMVQTKHFAEQ